jgi:hypothetical protein
MAELVACLLSVPKVHGSNLGLPEFEARLVKWFGGAGVAMLG